MAIYYHQAIDLSTFVAGKPFAESGLVSIDFLGFKGFYLGMKQKGTPKSNPLDCFDKVPLMLLRET